ncbi:MAG: KamA family radical SAM protein [Planctomycetota bacterium]|jgi:KamA family protein
MKYYTKIEQLEMLTGSEKNELSEVTEKFAFRANDYYLSLIDPDDPADPIRRIIVPSVEELEGWGHLDPSNEQAYTVMQGLEHKYASTVLLLVSNVCEGICRYCFRKRVFIHPQNEVLKDIDAMTEYISAHSEITNVLLTGGDPLVLSTNKLERIIHTLRQIEHVRFIRIGTRMTSFNPYRILDDPSLCEMIERYSRPDSKIYIMTHFTHPRELTDVALEAVHQLQKAGAVLTNQCPLIRGVNDDADTLAELMTKTASAGIAPYYLFQCRPALGNHAYTVPIEEGYRIVEGAKEQLSGLAKRFRYVMSHTTGKIEIIAVADDRVCLKYHRAAEDSDSGRILVCRSNPAACWLDDYDDIFEDYSDKAHCRFCELH